MSLFVSSLSNTALHKPALLKYKRISQFISIRNDIALLCTFVNDKNDNDL